MPLLLKTTLPPSAVVLATKLPLCSGDVKLEVGVPGVQLLSTSLSASGIAVNPRRFSMDSLWRMVAAAAGGIGSGKISSLMEFSHHARAVTAKPALLARTRAAQSRAATVKRPENIDVQSS